MSRSHSTPANTLLERSPPADAGVAAVADLLDRPAETDLLVVSYRDGPDAWLPELRSRVGGLPPEVGFVNVSVETRSAASAAPPSDRSLSPSPSGSPSEHPSSSDAADELPVAVAVSDPTDLARIGVRASEYLEAWSGDGRRTAVVLDSVTAMLADVALERAFSFLHLLSGRVESVDGRGYFLADPAAHDDRVVTVVRELADDVVRLGASEE